MSQKSESPDTAAFREHQGELAARLEKIRVLEQQLTSLKHEFVHAAAAAAEEAEDEDEATFLLVTNKEKLFAIPITYVEEVIQMAYVSSLPEDIRGVVGLVDYHGELMAVIDLSTLISGRPGSPTVDSALVVCRSELMKFALLVDEATDVVTIQKDNLQVGGQVLPGAVRAIGVLRADKQQAVIIDVISILFAVQLDRVREICRSSLPPPPEEASSDNNAEQGESI